KLMIILLILAVAVAAFLGYVAMQPPDFRITRSTTIAATPAEVFAQVNDLHKFQSWSPWAKMDPNVKTAFEGPDAGEGAVFHWEGSSQVGAGTMTLIASKPGELVTYRIEFLKPFPGTNLAEFTFKPGGNGTLVTWSMSGRKSFVPKIFCVFMNMDKMVGDEFEKGLANLKAICEGGGKQAGGI
ncbi:MAG TPA: SRPBCC family protein, partial [Chthoniobacteraceae bacterium]|nr:SRPBCC family protein [Chthoniobacteraceae bacterium]